MTRPKVTITAGPDGGRVLVDGVDISNMVQQVRVTIGGCRPPVATLDVFVDKLEIDTDVAEAVRVLLPKSVAPDESVS